MKTIVCVWSTKYHPKYSPEFIGPGLGDLLRGTISLYEYCRKKKYTFYVDIQLHPLSSLLNVPLSPFSDHVKSHEGQIKFYNNPYDELEKTKEDVILVATNISPDEPISDEVREYMKVLLKPQKWVSDLLESRIRDLGLDTFNIFHMRCGDNEFFNRQNWWKRFVARQMFIKSFEQSDLLLTDSVKLKQELRLKYTAKTFTNTADHIGHAIDTEKLLNTLLEFYAICNAKKIKSYSRYSHTSGFVYFPSIIYDIPMETIVMPRLIRLVDIPYNIFFYYYNIFYMKILKYLSFAKG